MAQLERSAKIMAIYVGLELESQSGTTRIYSFFKSDGSRYGTLAVDTNTKEIVLLEAEDERARDIEFRRACRAIEKALGQGELPDKLCFAA